MDARVKVLEAGAATRPPRERPTREEAEAAVRTLIAWAGDDPDREGLATRRAASCRPSRSSTPATARTRPRS